MLDMERNCIVFGDGFHGMPPEGEIILCSCKKTQGSRGNVKAGKITGIESEREGIVSVKNYREAQGGRDNETLEEAFFRIRKKLGSPMCAVTAADYEDRVRKTPGLMIDSCHAVCGHREPESDRTQITLIVKPFSMHKRKRNRIVFEGYRNNILHYMETYRPLGIRLSVAEPEYMDIYVYLDISVKAQYQNAQQEVKEAVEQFFHIRENRFGALLSYSELYGILDRMEAVEEIRALSMDARGSRVIKTPEGTIRLPEHAVAVLKEAVYSFVAE
jgi:hypothetical protein